MSVVQSFAKLMGMANPMPWAKGIIAVLMATILPSKSTSGPPLLPGLIAASV
jgi:hypothetical protein